MPNEVTGSPREPAAIYTEMRDAALRMKPSDLGVGATDGQAYGVVMDIDIDGETASIASFSSGDASLYLSTGGGMIGGGGHANVAASAKRFVQTANDYRDQLRQTRSFSRPGAGQVTFYVLTPGGVLTATRPENELGKRRSDLSDLFYAGQHVLTQMRMSEEER